MSAKNNHELVNYTPQKFIKFFFEHETDISWSNVRERGFYYKNVKNFLSTFTRDNVLVVFYDDLKIDSQKFFNNVFSFLKIDKTHISNKEVYADSLYSENRILHKFFNLYSNILPNNFFNVLRKIYKYLRKLILKIYPTISSFEKKKIIDFYMDDIVKLERLLKVDLGKWKIITPKVVFLILSCTTFLIIKISPSFFPYYLPDSYDYIQIENSFSRKLFYTFLYIFTEKNANKFG